MSMLYYAVFTSTIPVSRPTLLSSTTPFFTALIVTPSPMTTASASPSWHEVHQGGNSVFHYHARTVKSTILSPAILHFLWHASTWPDVELVLVPSNMRLGIWSDTSHLSESDSRAWTSDKQPDHQWLLWLHCPERRRTLLDIGYLSPKPRHPSSPTTPSGWSALSSFNWIQNRTRNSTNRLLHQGPTWSILQIAITMYATLFGPRSQWRRSYTHFNTSRFSHIKYYQPYIIPITNHTQLSSPNLTFTGSFRIRY